MQHTHFSERSGRAIWASILACILIVLSVPRGVAQRASSAAPSDAQVRQKIVNASITSYKSGGGSCPCPFITCGGRSAYTRRGGPPPLHYPKDVKDKMVGTTPSG